jgi:hypothetical protein
VLFAGGRCSSLVIPCSPFTRRVGKRRGAFVVAVAVERALPRRHQEHQRLVRAHALPEENAGTAGAPRVEAGEAA